jgi:hypothetical protein
VHVTPERARITGGTFAALLQADLAAKRRRGPHTHRLRAEVLANHDVLSPMIQMEVTNCMQVLSQDSSMSGRSLRCVLNRDASVGM